MLLHIDALDSIHVDLLTCCDADAKLRQHTHFERV